MLPITTLVFLALAGSLDVVAGSRCRPSAPPSSTPGILTPTSIPDTTPLSTPDGAASTPVVETPGQGNEEPQLAVQNRLTNGNLATYDPNFPDSVPGYVIQGNVRVIQGRCYTLDGSQEVNCLEMTASSPQAPVDKRDLESTASVSQFLEDMNTKTDYVVRLFYAITYNQLVDTCRLEGSYGGELFISTSFFPLLTEQQTAGNNLKWEKVIEGFRPTASSGYIKFTLACSNGGAAQIHLDSIFVTNEVTREQIDKVSLMYDPARTTSTSSGMAGTQSTNTGSAVTTATLSESSTEHAGSGASLTSTPTATLEGANSGSVGGTSPSATPSGATETPTVDTETLSPSASETASTPSETPSAPTETRSISAGTSSTATETPPNESQSPSAPSATPDQTPIDTPSTAIATSSIEDQASSTPNETPSASNKTPSASGTLSTPIETPLNESQSASTPIATPSTLEQTPSMPIQTPSTPTDTASIENETLSTPNETPSTPTETHSVSVETSSNESTPPSPPSDTPAGFTQTPLVLTETPSTLSNTLPAESETPSPPETPSVPSQTPSGPSDVSLTPIETPSTPSTAENALTASDEILSTPSPPTETPSTFLTTPAAVEFTPAGDSTTTTPFETPTTLTPFHDSSSSFSSGTSSTPSALATPENISPSTPGILLPLYVYPSIRWLDNAANWIPLFKAVKTHLDIPWLIVINPFNGPGESGLPGNNDPNVISGVSQLNENSNVNLIGYLPINYARASIDEVTANITNWVSWSAYEDADISINGIFFDESYADADYMHTVVTLAREAFDHPITVVCNFGVMVSVEYYALCDIVLGFESCLNCNGAPKYKSAETIAANFPAGYESQGAVVVHSFTGVDYNGKTANVDLLTSYIKDIVDYGLGWFYFTSAGYEQLTAAPATVGQNADSLASAKLASLVSGLKATGP